MSIRLAHPLPGATPTDAFGWRPAIPSIGLPAQLHNGQDYAAPAGTLIRAAHAGTVIWKGWDSVGGGWGVQISNGTYSTLYFHMREISPLVTVGQRVVAGQGIGYVGSSGAATGPHLHLMLRLPGGNVDPVPYLDSSLPQKGPVMTPEESRMLKAIFDAIFRGGNSMKDNKKSLSQSVAEINTQLSPVTRGGKQVQKRQDDADTGTLVRQILARLEAIEKRIEDMS